MNILKSPNDEKQEIKPELSEYAEYLDSLYVTGDVILYRDRAVIPSSLRKHVVDSLHATHQGVSTMEPRAQSSVFWPEVTRDIEQVRARCMDCNVNTPSQAQHPTSPVCPPATPFEKIFTE